MLRPLPVPAIERLAQSVRHEEVAGGETVFEAGDVGDRFYVIASGTVDVLDETTVVRTMGPGRASARSP